MSRPVFSYASAFAAILTLLSGTDLRAQGCHSGSLGARGMQSQLLQAQVLQAQLLQAQLLQAQVSQAVALQNLQALQANRTLTAGPLSAASSTRQRTATPGSQVGKSANAGDEAAAAALVRDLTKGTPAKRQQALAAFKERDGDVYTRALANALPRLYGETRTQARALLAERAARSQPGR